MGILSRDIGDILDAELQQKGALSVEPPELLRWWCFVAVKTGCALKSSCEFL